MLEMHVNVSVTVKIVSGISLIDRGKLEESEDTITISQNLHKTKQKKNTYVVLNGCHGNQRLRFQQ